MHYKTMRCRHFLFVVPALAAGLGLMPAGRVAAQTFTNLHSFTGGSDGANPYYAGLVLSGNTLYGTTQNGGSSDDGTVFAVNTAGTGFTNLYNFTGVNDGANPQAGLVLSSNTLYGTAYGGGNSGDGTVFSLAPGAVAVAAPQLNITLAGTNVILTWPSSATGYSLQSNTNLVLLANWGAVSPAPIIINGQDTVTNPISVRQKFYRLSQ